MKVFLFDSRDVEYCAKCNKSFADETIDNKGDWNRKGRTDDYYCGICHTIDDERIIQIKKNE